MIIIDYLVFCKSLLFDFIFSIVHIFYDTFKNRTFVLI
nr:MAG TPA: hypothetical protein [Caudoviricetes sp.]